MSLVCASPHLAARGRDRGTALLIRSGRGAAVAFSGRRPDGCGHRSLQLADLLPRRRGKVDLSRLPPWRRWPKSGLQRLPLWKLPEVEAPIDVLACEDPSLVADAVCEVVPWKRRWDHHDWLHKVCAHVRRLLPQMEPRDVVRVILAFGELHTKRQTHTLLFHDYETYVSLFQALPVKAASEKTLLPLLRAYRRMDVSHEPFVRAACERVISGEVELEPADLAELVHLHSHLRIKAPRLFEFVAEVLDLRFPYFSEDQVGDLARAFCAMRYHSKLFFEVLHRELPYRLHEYAWWNLIDIAELYLELQVDDPDIVKRIGNEAFKLVFSMRSVYTAKALKVLAMLEAGDKRTYRLLIRTLPRSVMILSPQVAAEAVMACASIKVNPQEIYHRLPGSRLYVMLVTQLMRDIGALSAKMTCDVVASLAKAGHRQVELAHSVEGMVQKRPFKFHAEHLVSLLRDFAALGHKSPGLRAQLLRRGDELSDCTPSALCALPAALAAHPRAEGAEGAERQLLSQVSELLCKPGVYRLPTDPRAFRSKDDLWWQRLRQRHFRHRRRKAAAGATVNHGAPAPAPEPSSSAVAHISREECLQLVTGCAELEWRDEPLLEGAADWLCAGRRHAELEPGEVAALLEAFAALGFASPLLRAALEHAILRAAPRLRPRDCTRALSGALDLGVGARSAAVRALVRRCTAELAMIPQADTEALRNLSAALRHAAEEEVLAAAAGQAGAAPAARLPVEMHLFSEAVNSRFGERALARVI